MASSISSFPPTIYNITKNSPSGTSSFEDVASPPTQPIGPTTQLTYIYSAPPNFSISENTDLKYHQTAPTEAPLRGFASAGALVSVILDFAPNPTGEPGFMHRTKTLDHVVVLEGELELTLDGGETRLVKVGEVVVQRACWHSWKNPSKTKGARFLAILVGDEGAVEGGMETK
ncbi:hypothetical protein LCER1_G003378 [Lachnellula cervina]|uniref:Cupin type-2 domain-containing protein n=1 Tax=Lachnellula cervina TaxID=1316786 RepID=A0A7D8YYA0_9HELO|nr:hypothetical protein LCER1_G003378 [Lachnellula cervina]